MDDTATSEVATYEIRYERWCGWMLGALGMGRRFSRVVLGADDLVVTMGWAFSTEIPRSSIRRAVADDGWVLGWGVHGWGGRWLVNGSSRDLVRVEIDPPAPARVCFVPVRLRRLRVSVRGRDALLARLR